jgi:hypothetical protein
VELLSLAPHFVAPREDFRSSVSLEGDRISVRAEAVPYLGSYIEQAFRAEAPPLRPGDRFSRPRFDVVIRDASVDGLRAFDVELRPEERDRRLLLRGEGFELTPLR